MFFHILLKVLQLKSVFKLFKRYKGLILVCFLLLLLAFLLWLRTLNFSDIIVYKKQLFDFIDGNPILTVSLFFIMYLIASTLSLPGTSILSVIGGFLFGFIQGLLLSIIAITIGSCFAFLLIRRFFKSWFFKKAGPKIQKISKHLEQDEVYYLFAFRMFPFTPLFFTNLLMGLTSIRINLFFIVSCMAFLPGTAVYVNMGSQLSYLEDWKGLSDPYLLSSFALIAILPMAVRYTFKVIKKLKKSRQDLYLDAGSIF